MKTPLWLLLKRLDRLPLQERFLKTKALMEHEKPYSIRRKDLEDYLKGITTKRLKREKAA